MLQESTPPPIYAYYNVADQVVAGFSKKECELLISLLRRVFENLETMDQTRNDDLSGNAPEP
ncbi:MAG: hypothetical protein HQM08_23340 [Candidatus Riflebacteria bacterium]|nr:hypothetical protein [Candidatus Riflebacteria bacterium]